MINITKGWPNMYAVDLAVPVTDTDILEGMAISLASGKWVKGVPKGQMGFITGPEQFPTALDVKRVQNTSFGNGDYGTASAGVGEMGRGNMGGIALSNPLEFQTDQYASLTGGEVVYGATDGLFKQCVDAAATQILGQCRVVQSDLIGGNSSIANWQGGTTVATIYSLPTLLLP